jgi:ribonuclease BN (tRNA processing enzyme)
MELTVLGCSGTFPSADSGCSSYLVRHDGFTLMIDAGNGAVGALQRVGDLLEPSAILLSHLHADHCVDLVAYSYARRFHAAKPRPIPLYGPTGTQDRICQIFDKAPRDHLDKVYDFRTISASTYEIGPFRIQLVPTNHPVETYAVRVEADGRSLCYSADTGQSQELIEAARGVDLFLCEATWPDDGDYPSGVHLTPKQTGAHATAADVGRLVLTHTVAWLPDEDVLAGAAKTYAGPLELAAAEKTYSV